MGITGILTFTVFLFLNIGIGLDSHYDYKI